jgi:hypothetical protein
MGIISNDEKDYVEETIKDRNDLYKLLKSNNFTNSYIIVCWEGNQGKDIKKMETLEIKDVKKTNFNFDELIKYNLR